MSLFGSIGKALKGVAKSVAGSALGKLAVTAIPGVGPIAGAVIGTVGSVAAQTLLTPKGKKTMSMLPALPGGGGRMLPPIGKAIATAAPYAAGALAGGIIWDDQPRKKRRRRKGISAKDLSSFKRVARLVDKYAKPVHHFRNFKKG